MSKIKSHIGDDWYELLKDCLDSDYFKRLGGFLNDRRSSFDINVYPDRENIFKAFRLCKLDNLKVVIIGNEPYKNPSSTGILYAQNGLGPISKELGDLFYECETDAHRGLNLMFNYSLEDWAKQGVLLLSVPLTSENSSNSHSKQWKRFITHLFEKLDETQVYIIYVCLTKESKEYIPIFNKQERNIILEINSVRNSKMFSKINKFLIEVANGLEVDPEQYKIKW
jgi:uracil-DNA glycosylase